MIKPDYYDDFNCIAGDCPFTCCQQWKIAVDEDTLKDWHTKIVPERYIKRDPKAEGTTLDKYVRVGESGEEMSLCENGFCTFFNEKGLCDVVLEYGEETISNTCHTFPREEHEYEGTVEKTLALGCPAVVDLLWNKKRFGIVGKADSADEDEKRLFFVRDTMMNFISDGKYPLDDSIRMMFFMLLDMFDKYEEDGEMDFLTENFVDSYMQNSFLKELYSQITKLRVDTADNIYEQNELFLDVADNYRKKGIYSEFLEPLAEIASKYEEDEFTQEFLDKRKDFEVQWEGLQDKMRLVFAEEIFSTLYMPEGDLYSMVMKAQWIGIYYAVLKQMLFLKWCQNDNDLTYELIRETICVLTRMTGYSEADIEEYLENSFEEIIWEWGYMNLIL